MRRDNDLTEERAKYLGSLSDKMSELYARMKEQFNRLESGEEIQHALYEMYHYSNELLKLADTKKTDEYKDDLAPVEDELFWELEFNCKKMIAVAGVQCRSYFNQYKNNDRETAKALIKMAVEVLSLVPAFKCEGYNTTDLLAEASTEMIIYYMGN